jgi:hypothetical protein
LLTVVEDKKENGSPQPRSLPFSQLTPHKEATLILAKYRTPDKENSIRLRPNLHEGLNIQYKLKDLGESFALIGARLSVGKNTIYYVVFGRRRSARVEAEIARVLGKSDWNEVVLEARSAITGKPVNELVDEINRKLQARDAAFASGLAAAKARAAAPRTTDAAPTARRAV